MANNERLYAERDIEELGDYRMRHLLAMTAEALHSKSEIADELAYRDKIIDDLRAQLAAKPAPVECVPVAWGFPNTAISGKNHALMLVQLEVPSDDQYGGALWVPLYLNPLDAETRAMVLELCDSVCEHVKVWEYPYGNLALELAKQIRERMGLNESNK